MKVLNTILILIFGALIALLLLQRCDKPEPEAEEEETYEALIVVVDAETDEPIEGAKVKLKVDGEQIALVTDENGACSFEYTDPDAVIKLIRATKSGYEPAEIEDYDVSNFEDEDLVIPLNPQDVAERGRDIGASGNLKITLMWDDPNVDLDLHVVETIGNRSFEIYYEGGRETGGHMVSPISGGCLDVDWMPGNSRDIGENIVWANPPRGTYKPFVYCYNPEGVEGVDCVIVVYRENEEPKEYPFTLSYHDQGNVPDIVIQN